VKFREMFIFVCSTKAIFMAGNYIKISCVFVPNIITQCGKCLGNRTFYKVLNNPDIEYGTVYLRCLLECRNSVMLHVEECRPVRLNDRHGSVCSCSGCFLKQGVFSAI
jgi:hypothetical protein